MSANPLRSEAQSPYRWVVVGVSATVNSLAWSVRSTFAVFYVALLGEFAWRRGEAAIGYSFPARRWRSHRAQFGAERLLVEPTTVPLEGLR